MAASDPERCFVKRVERPKLPGQSVLALLLGLLQLLDERLAQDDHETIGSLPDFRLRPRLSADCFDMMISVLPQDTHAISSAADRPMAPPLASRDLPLPGERRVGIEARRRG